MAVSANSTTNASVRKSANSSISSRPKSPSRHAPDLGHLFPADTRRWQNNPLCDAVPATNLDWRVGDIQHLYHHFVVRSRVVGIDHANPVRDHQATLQRRAAAGEYGKKVTARNFDDEARPDEYYLAGSNGDVVSGGEVKA